MAESKLQIKVGIVEFNGEGESTWLSEQLDKVLDKIPELLKLESQMPVINSNTEAENNQPSQVIETNNVQLPSTLVGYLREKNATTNQLRKFLATAAYLQLKGKSTMTTGDITKSLRDAQQSKLGNASDCLNKNVGKGHCEKQGNEFFVTPEGFKEL